MGTQKWIDEVYEVINELGGKASLREIYERVEARQCMTEGKLLDGHKASIRNIIYENSSECVKFLGHEDLFYSVEGKGKGKWAIRNTDNEDLQRLPEELKDSELDTFIEGSRKQIFVNAYERNTKATKHCIEIHGAKCAICGFDFGKFYGSDFDGKIHVHHKIPLHEIDDSYEVDPKEDLIPVCPNCHLVLHSKIDGTYSIEEVKKFVNVKLQI